MTKMYGRKPMRVRGALLAGVVFAVLALALAVVIGYAVFGPSERDRFIEQCHRDNPAAIVVDGPNSMYCQAPDVNQPGVSQPGMR